MKKLPVLLLILALSCACAYAESDGMPQRTLASYEYVLAEGDELYIENLIFNEPVIVSGDSAQIIFSNCEFNRGIILTADAATRVLLLGCDVNSPCTFSGGVQECTFDYAFPKILADTPIEVVCENCIGTVVALGDFSITFNGQSYSIADAQLFSDAANPDAGLVPYEGQEAAYFILAQWWENGEQNILVLAEKDS